MNRWIFPWSFVLVAIALWGQPGIAQTNRKVTPQLLQPISGEKLKYVGLDNKLGSEQTEQATPSWDEAQRQALVQAVDYSLDYLSTPKAARSYQKPISNEFTLERVRRSLLRFKELLLTTTSPAALEKAVKAEFEFYQSVGNDQRGKVDFTGYFEPTYTASRVKTEKYRYPLYRMPNSLKSLKHHPTRAQLEGQDGLGSQKSILQGQELVWLSDRLEAFLVQVQGSARLKLTDGTTMTVGYSGSTNYPYVSVGGELVKDGVFGKEQLTLPKLLDYFQENPQQLDKYLPRNNRFVFFRQTNNKPPTGNLGVPVTGDRSIATDKSILPPGALALIVSPIPEVDGTGKIKTTVVSRYVLDQDTGSAIKGAGRVDIFLGSGDVAQSRAGLLNGSGSLFYLLLKDN